MDEEERAEKGWGDKFLVAAIDFGTTYSGYAYSFLSDYAASPESILTYEWTSEDNQRTIKTPTCLLLKPDKTVHSFGYDAETHYHKLITDMDFAEQMAVEDYKKWHFFDRFKMALYGEDDAFYKNPQIWDSMGRKFPAKDIFSKSIKFLKDHLLAAVKEAHPTAVKDEEVYYVVTTPAIWSETAKQFMRDAAETIGIKADHLRIALEPECAALLCKKIGEIEQDMNDSTTKSDGPKPLGPDSRYMVLDMGGGTVDITVHEVREKMGLCEVQAPCGGPWGGDSVNQEFKNFIKGIVGAKVYKEFHDNDIMDYLTLMRSFESKKCAEQRDTVYLTFPTSLAERYYKEHQVNFQASVKGGRFEKTVMIGRDKFRISREAFEGFFAPSIKEILATMEKIMKAVKKPVDTLLLVGGFSNCVLVKEAIRKRFPASRLINPKLASTAVLKGAIIYGRQPEIIQSRICRYTYGIDWNEPFDETVHHKNKKEIDYCKDIFKKIVERDSIIPYNYTTEVIETGVKYDQQNRIDFPFYRSDAYSPKYVDDPSCKHIGTLTVYLPKGRSFLDQTVYLVVEIGGTEIQAKAWDENGDKHVVKFTVA